jgi:hypothetical protein
LPVFTVLEGSICRLPGENCLNSSAQQWAPSVTFSSCPVGYICQ